MIMTKPYPKKCTGIVFWNARSIIKKKDNFKISMGNVHYKVFCITESWLKPNLYSSFLSIKMFNSFKPTDTQGNCMGDMEAAESVNKFCPRITQLKKLANLL